MQAGLNSAVLEASLKVQESIFEVNLMSSDYLTWVNSDQLNCEGKYYGSLPYPLYWLHEEFYAYLSQS